MKNNVYVCITESLWCTAEINTNCKSTILQQKQVKRCDIDITIQIHTHTHTHTHIHKMEYYSAIKKNEILPFAATWMDLEGIILSEISQTEKDKYCMISPICRI